MKLFIAAAFCLVVFGFAPDAFSQRKPAIVSKVCGDPSAVCEKRAAFKNDDIPFSYVEFSVVAETAEFYAVILKSTKFEGVGDCETPPEGFNVDDYQHFFLKNKVFIARGCYDIEHNFYKGLDQKTMAVAVFAGHTKAAADAFLKKVKANEYLNSNGAYILKMSTGFNGT
jgi:hypothetical protein